MLRVGRTRPLRRGALRRGVPASLLAVDDDGRQDPPRGDECQIHSTCAMCNVSNTVRYYGYCGYCVDAISIDSCKAARSPGPFCCGTHRRPSICQIQWRTGPHVLPAGGCCCGGCSHPCRRKDRAFVMVATSRWICSARHRTQRARAYNSVDRPSQTGRDETPWRTAANGTAEQPHSTVTSVLGDPSILQGRGVRDERPGSWLKAVWSVVRGWMQDPWMQDDVSPLLLLQLLLLLTY